MYNMNFWLMVHNKNVQSYKELICFHAIHFIDDASMHTNFHHFFSQNLFKFFFFNNLSFADCPWKSHQENALSVVISFLTAVLGFYFDQVNPVKLGQSFYHVTYEN